jgi:hypothetical protein
MITTIVTWMQNTPNEEAVTAINDRAAQMAVDGKTDNNPLKVPGGPEQVTTRTWTTLADAEEWILFVEQYSPISATIQS